MKNELGIEICCENCHNKQYNMCVSEFGFKCKAEGKKCFITSDKAYKARIKELQEQLEISENAYHKTLDAYHDVAEQLEELKARSRQ